MIVSSFAMNCMRKSSAVLCLIALFMTACKEQEKKAEKTPEATTSTTVRFFNPPVKGVDVPYKEYQVDAAKGDTLVYYTGSIIFFPPNAFVDEAGKPVTGNVQVKYREFKDPIDFFLAGVPMRYDSAGVQYQLVSSGMLDIRAFKDGKPVFVNKASKPEINLASENNFKDHSLYFLDTVQRKWINRGGNTVLEPKKLNATSGIVSASETVDMVEEPVKPSKADNKSPVLKIEVDPSSFGEFAIYRNQKFQVDENKTPFNKKDSEEEWNNLELLKGAQKGSYMAKFSNAKKSVVYAVKPVFQGEDYEAAIKVFDIEYARYKQKLQERAEKELAQKNYRKKADHAAFVKDSILNAGIIESNKKIEMLNAIIARKNIDIKVQNLMIAKKNDEIKRKKELNAKKTVEYIKELEMADKIGKVYRSMIIDGFGLWNCDVATRQKTVSVIANFKNKKGNELFLQNITVINKSLNSILEVAGEFMLIVPDTDNMILGTYEGKLAYVSFEEFKKLYIKTDSKELTITVEIVEGDNTNYEYIKSLLKQ
jgi:hypothetical protein